MPEQLERQPLIFEIYEAFDSRSLHIFRDAMDRSRGGVVCVEDLLAALAEHEGLLLGDDVLAARSQLSRLAHREERLVPMSNEPALWDVLASAYRLALSVGNGQATRITPAILWRALGLDRRQFLAMPLTDDFSRLGLPRSAALADCVVTRPPSVRPPKFPVATASARHGDYEQMLDEILARWLEAHRDAERREQHQTLAGLEEQVRRLETLPEPRF